MTQKSNIKNYTDIRQSGFVMRFLPEKLRPYALLMRLDRPIGWWLLLLPGWWSIALASGGISGMDAHKWVLMTLFLIGAVAMRGAGCVVNDLWDRHIDKLVERTRGRPLASGMVSVKQGFAFLGGLLFVGACILLSLSEKAIILGFAVLPLIALYPYMKRITYWPQLFLGITFNFSALIGWAAVHNEISAAPVLLYLGGIFWTIGYDTIYAHQDKEDDVMAGVKSTALKFGRNSKRLVFCVYLMAIVLISVAIMSVKMNPTILALLMLPIFHMAWQLRSWNMDDQENSLRIFKSNRYFGLLLVIICLL
ncbi:MAG: 4-hydroxybenzoate octaprenyltransferase [Micavibrio sp.]|nr:4-hydroxybenzoate octaprenyltransferase [Micavibrio sp.]|tara:strand:- start:1219 stop:2142 length:924 start_codon:yes stop_codon:yes gene_type:complete